jgi:O-antigen/teichoic acid export membrane protein
MDLISLLSVLFIIATTVVVPQYGVQMVIVYSILILGRIINNASTGYAALLIARGKERYLVIYGFLSILAVAVCGVCAHYLKLPVEYMALSVSIASFVYTYLVIRLALSDLGNPSSVRSILCDIFGMNKWLACLIIVLNAFVMHSYIVLLGCILLYCFVNIRNIRRAVTSGMQIVSDKNALIF